MFPSTNTALFRCERRATDGRQGLVPRLRADPASRWGPIAHTRDAGHFIAKLLKTKHDAREWQAAMEALMLVAKYGGSARRNTGSLASYKKPRTQSSRVRSYLDYRAPFTSDVRATIQAPGCRFPNYCGARWLSVEFVCLRPSSQIPGSLVSLVAHPHPSCLLRETTSSG